jgi:polysaccharide export outer membrane protein
MKEQCSCAGRGLAFLAILWAALLITGCHFGKPHFETPPSDIAPPGAGMVDKFRIGDSVMISFSGSGPDFVLQPHKEAVKGDGTITPPLVGSVTAVGRTPGELQAELQTKYNALYRNITVTVLPADRYYYVSGEVRKPGPEPYLGEMDIINAISAAGDFTDFANKRKVLLTRGGQTQTINVSKIINGSADRVPVYPGDTIVVKRRLF